MATINQEPTELTKEELLKKFKKRGVIIRILSIAVAVFLLIFLWEIENTVNFLPGEGGPQHKPYYDAQGQVKKFRNKFINLRRKSRGVYYDTGGFRAFIDSFSSIVASESANKPPIPDTLKWVVGFYWMMTPDSLDKGIFKNDFCIAPTLVSKKYPRIVKDYFDTSNNTLYNHSIDAKIRHLLVPNDDGNAYDAGTLWP